MEKITSLQNPRVKLISRLRDKKGRQQEGRFVIDYERDLERALLCGYEIDFTLYCPEHDSQGIVLPEASTFEVSPELMGKISYRDNPSAVVSVLKARTPKTLGDATAFNNDLILGLVSLEKPGNIGALLRTADALGIQTVFIIDSVLDRYNPNIIRSSTGAVFLDQLYMLSTTEALQFLRDRHYQIIAAAVDGEFVLTEMTFTTQTAVILGSEDTGLPAEWQSAAAARVRIPMRGKLTDSLNVSVSGAMFLYEAVRQHWRQK